MLPAAHPWDVDDGAGIVLSQHLGPGGRGGREAVKVVIEQALTLGLGLLGNPAFDGLGRSASISRRLTCLCSNTRVDGTDSVSHTGTDTGTQQATVHTANGMAQQSAYATVHRATQPSPRLSRDLPKIALESNPWACRSAAVLGPDAPTFASEIDRRMRLSRTLSS